MSKQANDRWQVASVLMIDLEHVESAMPAWNVMPWTSTAQRHKSLRVFQCKACEIRGKQCAFGTLCWDTSLIASLEGGLGCTIDPALYSMRLIQYYLQLSRARMCGKVACPSPSQGMTNLLQPFVSYQVMLGLLGLTQRPTRFQRVRNSGEAE
eukprot:3691213-Amphidinium_carterae.1